MPGVCKMHGRICHRFVGFVVGFVIKSGEGPEGR